MKTLLLLSALISFSCFTQSNQVAGTASIPKAQGTIDFLYQTKGIKIYDCFRAGDRAQIPNKFLF